MSIKKKKAFLIYLKLLFCIKKMFKVFERQTIETVNSSLLRQKIDNQLAVHKMQLFNIHDYNDFYFSFFLLVDFDSLQIQ